jgi:CRP/FNR family transcriptional regulator, cyclic AMP receptor protein
MLTLLEKVSLLQKALPFQGIRTESLARVAAVAHEADFEARHTLFRESDNPDTMFVVLEGEISVLQNGQERKKLGPNEVAGIMSLLASEPYSDSAVAAQASRTLRIDQQDFYDVLAEDFGVTRGILKALVRMASGGE